MSLRDDKASTHRRIYKACVSCRQRKVKCDLGLVDAPHDPPCARCRRENRDCYFDAKKPKGTTQSYLEDVSHPVKRRKLHHSNSSHDRQSVRVSSTDDLPIEGAGLGTQQSNGLQVLDEDNALPDAGAYTSEDTLNLLYSRALRSDERDGPPNSADNGDVEQEADTVDHDRGGASDNRFGTVHDIWSRLVFVQDGLFSVDEAFTYLQFFKDHLNPLTPISCAQYLEPESHGQLLTQEPVLAVTILMITSRFCSLPGIGALSRRFIVHERLWQFLQQLIGRIFWAEDEPSTTKSDIRLRSIGTCEALLLLSEWHARTLHFPPGREGLRILTGGWSKPRKNAVVSSDPSAWKEWSWRSDRLTWSLIWTAFGLAGELGVFETSHGPKRDAQRSEDGSQRLKSTLNGRAERLRHLLMIFITMTSSRIGSRIPMSDALRVHSSVQLDAVTKLWADLATLTHDVQDTLFASRAHVREIIESKSYIGLLFLLAPRLQEFKRSFDKQRVPQLMRIMLRIEYDYLRAHTNSIAMQAAAKRERDGIQTSQDRGDDFVAETVDGARAVLRTVVEELSPMEALKFIPIRTYYRILTSVIFLIKAIKITNSSSEAEVSCALIERVGIEMSQSIADDANLGFRWGKMMIDLSRKERQILAQRQNSTTADAPLDNFTPVAMPNGDISPSSSNFLSIGDPQTWVSFPLTLDDDFSQFTSSFWDQDPMPGQFGEF